MKENPNWGEFVRRRLQAQIESHEDISELFARHFTSPDGREVISWIRSQTKERIIPAGAADAVLRQHEGQRELCDRIERLIEQGVERIRSRNKSV